MHRDGDEVAVYTRTLDDITARVPEVVSAVLALPVRRGRARRRGDRAAAGRAAAAVPGHRIAGRRRARRPGRETVPLTPYFFDVLHLDGHDLLGLDARRAARAALSKLVPEELRCRGW